MPQPVVLHRTTGTAAPATLLFGEPAVATAPALTRLWIGDGTTNRLLLSSNPTDPLGPPIGTSGFLPLSGGQMAGALKLLPPVAQTDAASKDYVDTEIAALRSFIGTWQVAANVPNITAGAATPGDYHIAVTANPTVPETAPAGIPGIGGQTVNNGDIVIWDAVGSQWELIRGGPLTVAEANALYVELTGDAMTGPLVLASAPTLPMEAANRGYVDGLVGSYLPLTGGVLTGNLTVSTGAAGSLVVNSAPVSSRGLYIQTAGILRGSIGGSSSGFLDILSNSGLNISSISGAFNISTVTGNIAINASNSSVNITGADINLNPTTSITASVPITLPSDPTSALEAATKQYVDNSMPAGGPFLPLTGGTLTGGLTFNAGNITAGPGNLLFTLTGSSAGGIVQLQTANSSTGATGAITLRSGQVSAGGFGAGNVVISGGSSNVPTSGGSIVFNTNNGNPRLRVSPITATSGSILVEPNTTFTLAQDPGAAMEAATRQYVDALGNQLANYLPLTGGVMAGAITLLPPVNPQDAVNKDYVDSTIADLRLFIGTWQVAANTPDITPGAPSPGDYHIAVTAVPTTPETAPAGIPGIGGQVVNNGDMVIWDAGNSIWELIRGGPLTIAEANTFYVQKTGDAMTGGLGFGNTNAPSATNTSRHITLGVSGGINTGVLYRTGTTSGGGINFIVGSVGNRYNFWQGTGLISLFIDNTGAQFEVPLYINNNFAVMDGWTASVPAPTQPNHAATKQYVDGLTSGGPFLPIAGGTLTGQLNINTTANGNIAVTNTARGVISVSSPGSGSTNRPSIVLNPSAGSALSIGLNAVNVAGVPNLQISSFNDVLGTAPAPYTIFSPTEIRFFTPVIMDAPQPLTLGRDPVGNLEAATKQYVDNNAGAVADGVSIIGAGSAGSPLTVALIDGGVF